MDALTFTPFQLVDVRTCALELPADVLNVLPDTANLEERFKPDLVQAKEDCGNDKEERSEKPHSHDEGLGA